MHESATRIGGDQTLSYSLGWRAGDFVFTAGQIAVDEKGVVVDGGIEMQTRIVMRRLEAILKQAGCGLDDVVKATVWLQDARDFRRFDSAYAEFFAGPPPARSIVRSDLVIDCKVEVELVAYKPVLPPPS
jgi:2-iminobutanoate/2-iminopropanoate deaminase